MSKFSSYNGYTSEQRQKGGEWQKVAYKFGVRPRPSRCLACGETQGVIVGHWETYDEPFDSNKDIPLCSICHLMVHCRNRNPKVFERYTEMIDSGYRPAAPMMKFDWAWFQTNWLTADNIWEIVVVNEDLPIDVYDPGILRRIATGVELEKARIKT